MASTSRPSNIAEWGSEIDRLIDSDSDTSEIDYALHDFQDSNSDSENESGVQIGAGDAPSKHGRRRDTIYWCPQCEAGLCLEQCFKTYHTVTHF